MISLALPLHRGGRTGVGLLPIDAPVAQFVERDRLAGDGATDEGSRPNDPKIAVDKLEFRFACVGRTTLESVHREYSRLNCLYATNERHRNLIVGRGRSRYCSGQDIACSGKCTAMPAAFASRSARLRSLANFQFFEASPQNTG